MDTKLPLVIVEWTDAWGDNEVAISMEDVESHHRALIVETMGWLLREDENGVSLANEVYNSNFRGRTFIPRGMIKSITPYRLTRTRKKAEDT